MFFYEIHGKYLRTFLFLFFSLFLINNLFADDPIVSSKKRDNKSKQDSESQDQKELNNAKVIVGFKEEGNSQKSVKFFLMVKKSFRSKKSPEYIKIERENSDLRLLDVISIASFSKSITLLSATEKNSLFNNLTLTKTEKEDALLILELSQLQNEDLILDTLQFKTKKFSYQRKLEVLAAIGKNFNTGYDNLRTDDSHERSQGIVTIEDLFGAIKSSLDSSTKVNAGVCRDMHLAMAKMASRMGIKNAYGVSFDTRYGAHMITTTTPNQYGIVNLINYDKIYNFSDQAGVSNLETYDSLTSFGQYFKIASADTNNQLLIIPTRLADALIRISGGDSEKFLYSGQNEKDFLKLGVKTKFGDLYLANFEFLGNKPGQVSGIFYQLNKNFSLLSFNGSIGYIDSERLNGDLKTYESGLYLRSNLDLHHSINLKKGLKLKGNFGHNFSLLYSCRKTSDREICVQDDNEVPNEYRRAGKSVITNANAGFGLEFKKNNIISSIDYELNLQLLEKDVRILDSQFYLGVAQHKLSSNVEFNCKKFHFVGFGVLIFTDLENQMVKTYIVGSKILYKPLGIAFLGQKSGRIENQDHVAPSWLPGTENITLARLLYESLKLQGQLGFEVQLSDDFPQYDTGFIIFRIEH